jgi:hypothetical protein
MRAFATPAILQFVCSPSLGTLVKIIKVQVQEVENGPWVDRTITGAAAEGTDGEGNIALLGQFWNSSPTTTTAININIVGPS